MGQIGSHQHTDHRLQILLDLWKFRLDHVMVFWPEYGLLNSFLSVPPLIVVKP